MIDIVVWDEDPATFVANAMKPANVERVELGKDGKAAVIVAEDQLSIAIGKAGQNVRLAGKLTGYELDVESDKKPEKADDTAPAEVKPDAPEATDKQADQVESKPVVQKLKKKTELEDSLLKAIEEHGE